MRRKAQVQKYVDRSFQTAMLEPHAEGNLLLEERDLTPRIDGCLSCDGPLNGGVMRCPECVEKAWQVAIPRATSLLKRLDSQRPTGEIDYTKEDFETDADVLKQARLAQEGLI